MKKILIYALCIAAVITGCRKEDDPVLDDPDERLIAILAEYQDMLVNADNGWKAITYPNGGGGYAFYINFSDDNGVSMIGDIDTNTASTFKGSTWRLKALQLPTLMFDTYTYLHILSDPDNSKNGGVQGLGLEADFEFAIVSVGDTIQLKGLYNETAMTLVKATAAEASAYQSEGLSTMLKRNDEFVKNTAYPYLEFEDGNRIQLDIAGKNVGLTWLDASDNVVSLSSAFSFTLDGIHLKEPLQYGGNSFQDLYWDDAAKTYYLLINNVRTDVLSSPTPIIPIYFRLGYGKDFATITVKVDELTGLSDDFLQVYNTAKAGLAAVGNNAGRTLDYFYIRFSGTTEMSMRVYYHNVAGTNYTANFIFDINWLSESELQFIYRSRDGNANTAGPGIVALTDYLTQNDFTIDWAANLTPGSIDLLGGFYTVTNPDSFFFGVLSQ